MVSLREILTFHTHPASEARRDADGFGLTNCCHRGAYPLSLHIPNQLISVFSSIATGHAVEKCRWDDTL